MHEAEVSFFNKEMRFCSYHAISENCCDFFTITCNATVGPSFADMPLRQTMRRCEMLIFF